MKVLLIGSGGREHALAWKLADSPHVTELFIAPGNAGTARLGQNVPLDVTHRADVDKFIRKNGIGFVVIGPEDPLAAGLADFVRGLGVPVFGPSKEAAQIEADKWFAKELMRQQAIPTAEARSFTDASSAEALVRERDTGCVIKAAGLAKGKGVIVCRSVQDALNAIDTLLRKRAFGEASERIVIEELLKGPEVSILALVDGNSVYVLESAQDHKQVNDGDTGPMTGGMGAYSPTPIMTPAILKQVERDILLPAIDGLRREGIEYSGVLYAGLMLTVKGPQVLEFNCRFGDPETQPLMMRLKSDLFEVLLATAQGKLAEVSLNWDPRPALAVVATSGGYPGAYKSGFEISGIDQADAMPDIKVFQAGTKLVEGKTVSDGGRVLSVTALGRTFAEAQRRAYEAMSHIQFEGMHYRRDIGHQAVKKEKDAE